MLALLDRDGVINVDRPDSVKIPDELILLPGAADAVARLNAAGWQVAVITNQSVVGRGIISEAALAAIHTRLRTLLAAEGARLDAIYYCPDHPDAPTPRRKPGAAMLYEALAYFGATATHTPMIGDALRDMQAAAEAGCPRYLVRTGKGAATLAAGIPEHLQPVSVCDDLAAAVAHIV